MRVFTMPQKSPEWWKIKCGRPSGSQAKRIVTAAKGDLSSGSEDYAAELVAECLGWRRTFRGSDDTDRGNRLEYEAVQWLELRYGWKSRPIGFCMSDCGRYGMSPDGLLGDGRPLEVKSPDVHTMIKWKMGKKLPDDHRAQVHFEMAVTGAPGAVFLAYTDHPAIENLMIEVQRDPFTEKLAAAVTQFCDRLDALREEMLGEEAQFYQPKPASDFAEWEEKP